MVQLVTSKPSDVGTDVSSNLGALTRTVFVFVFKVAVNTIVPRSPFFLFLYLKTQTDTHIRKNAVEYLCQ